MISSAGAAALPLFGAPRQSHDHDARHGQTPPIHPHTEDPASGGGRHDAPTASRVNPAEDSGKPRSPGAGTKANGETLSEEEESQVRKLKDTDAKVRAHEQAHAAAGGPFASAPSYEFTTGPDGKRYATSGEVEIDTAPERGDPEATIRKMDVVIRAALSPADPSPQDLQVARNAQQERARAQVELFKKRDSESRDNDGGNAAGPLSQPLARADAIDARMKQALAAYGAAADQAERASTAIQGEPEAQLFAITA